MPETILTFAIPKWPVYTCRRLVWECPTCGYDAGPMRLPCKFCYNCARLLETTQPGRGVTKITFERNFDILHVLEISVCQPDTSEKFNTPTV